MITSNQENEAARYIIEEYDRYYDKLISDFISSNEYFKFIEELEKTLAMIELKNLNKVVIFLNQLEESIPNFSSPSLYVEDYIECYTKEMISKHFGERRLSQSHINTIINKEKYNYGTLDSLCEGILSMLKDKHVKGK